MAKSRFEQFPMEGVDLDHPNVARVYDYYLGGKANYAVDRVFAEKALERFPFVRPAAKSNRLFLHRAVRYLVKQGVRQFIDVGSGVPTMGSTHQVADELDTTTRVVYIDNEPVAVAHSQMLLEKEGDLDRHAVIQADLRDPDLLWNKVADSGVIDFAQPVALLLIAVLHVTQPGPDGTDIGPAAVARYRELLAPGSYLVLSHGTADGVPESRAREMAEFGKMYDATATPVIWRPRGEIEALFGDLEMVEPGATWTPLWHPEENGANAPEIEFDSPNDSVVWAGVARKA
ncbi:MULTISPECIES: SAM-dependent methyltransferase [Amycolatopsis]|uniref:SAM-dependent methyltransferase n=1 Tax=Amycolatopsis thermalba TaxID=944492 RepID=A0ABY4P0W4_9PSEU|nr:MULTISPECIES: SAM-dependent methyltransferase [Amycolatopsis]OXM64590.1 methyltransferase [Amycolatopsis sp. KNN50.9b]UQS25883.1 SAM-dependent methyltransferase [Amycolatopsis thermalba]